MNQFFSNITWSLVRSSWQKGSVEARREFAYRGYKPYAARPELRPRLVDLFIEGLSDSEEGTRRAAARALGELADPRAIVPLIQRLPTARAYELNDVVEALGVFGDPRAIAPLALALHRAYGDSKRAIEFTLARFAKPGLPASVMAAALTDESGYEKARAPWAKDTETMSRLVRWPPQPWTIEHPNYGLNTPGLQQRIEEATRRMSEALDQRRKQDLGEWLMEQRTPEEWRRKDPQVEFDQELASILRHVKGELEMLEGAHPYVLCSLIGLLREAGDPVAIDAFTQMLRHSSSSVRASAIRALGEMPGPDTVIQLLPFLTAAEGRERRNTAEALAKLDYRDAAPQLIELLRNDDSHEVRCKAAEALGKFGCLDAVPQLIELLRHDPSWDVHGQAAEALRLIGDPRAVEAFIECLAGPNSWSHDPKDELFSQFASQQMPAWHSAVRALANIEHPTKNQLLLEVLANPEARPFQRIGAAEVLGRLRDRAAIPVLIAVLNEDNGNVRLHALSTLGGYGGLDDLAPVIALLGDPAFAIRYEAAGVLRKSPRPSSLGPMLDCYRELEVSRTLFSEIKRGRLRALLADGMNKIVAESSTKLSERELRDVSKLQDATVPVSEYAAESYAEGWRNLSFEETRQRAREELIRRFLPL